MNIELLELAKSALGELADQVVLVGGAGLGARLVDRPVDGSYPESAGSGCARNTAAHSNRAPRRT